MRFRVLLCERLDHTDAGERVVHHGVHGGGTPPERGVCADQLGNGELDHQHDRDNGNKQEQCQLPADTEQHDRQRNVGQHVHDKVGNAINEEAADTLGVIVDAVDKPSGWVLIEVGKRLVLHGAEDIILHITHHAGGHIGVDPVLDNADTHGHDRQGDQHADPQEHVLFLVQVACFVDDAVIEDLSADDGGRNGDSRVDQQAQRDDDELRAEVAEIAEQSVKHALFADAVLADLVLLIGVGTPAFGAYAVELLKNLVVSTDVLTVCKPLPNSGEGEQLELAGIGAVAQDDRCTGQSPRAGCVAELLIGHVPLHGRLVIRSVAVYLQTVGGSVVVNVRLG